MNCFVSASFFYPSTVPSPHPSNCRPQISFSITLVKIATAALGPSPLLRATPSTYFVKHLSILSPPDRGVRGPGPVFPPHCPPFPGRHGLNEGTHRSGRPRRSDSSWASEVLGDACRARVLTPAGPRSACRHGSWSRTASATCPRWISSSS